MKKLLPYFVLFMLLGTILVVLRQQNRSGTMAALSEERDFSIEKVETIGKIFLVHRDGEQVLLERKGDHWMYNGRWKARQDAITNLLDAISRLQVQYKPASAAVPAMVQSLAAEGIKVEIYDRRNRKLKTYYIGGSSVDERGVFAILEGFEQPYVAHLDGWEGNPRFRYNLKGEDWRDRSIFDEDPDKISEVHIEYPTQRNQSFRLIKKKGDYEVLPYYPITPRIAAPLRAGGPQRFLSAFESLAAEDFRNAFPAKDSIISSLPFAIVTVKQDKGGERTAKFYPIFPESGTALPTDRRNIEPERYFVATGSGDFMLAQHRVIKKILWGYPFFFDK